MPQLIKKESRCRLGNALHTDAAPHSSQGTESSTAPGFVENVNQEGTIVPTGEKHTLKFC